MSMTKSSSDIYESLDNFFLKFGLNIPEAKKECRYFKYHGYLSTISLTNFEVIFGIDKETAFINFVDKQIFLDPYKVAYLVVATNNKNKICDKSDLHEFYVNALAFLIEHEILHFIHRHYSITKSLATGTKTDNIIQKSVNIAGDYHINNVCKKYPFYGKSCNFFSESDMAKIIDNEVGSIGNILNMNPEKIEIPTELDPDNCEDPLVKTWLQISIDGNPEILCNYGVIFKVDELITRYPEIGIKNDKESTFEMAEKLTKFLIENQLKKEKKSGNAQSGQGCCCNSCDGESGDDDNDDENNEGYEKCGYTGNKDFEKLIDKIKNNENYKNVLDEYMRDKEKNKKDYVKINEEVLDRKLSSGMRDAMNNKTSTSYGITPGDIAQILESMKVEKKINWKQLLRYLKQKEVEKEVQFRMRFNKRYGTIPQKYNKYYHGEVLIFLDVSASMSIDELSMIYSQLRIMDVPVWLVTFDTEIHDEYHIKPKHKPSCKITGRGGTCIEDCIKYAESHKKLNYLIITDGDFSLYDVDQMPKNHNCMFLLTYDNKNTIEHLIKTNVKFAVIEKELSKKHE